MMKHRKQRKADSLYATAPMQAAMEIAKNAGSDTDPEGSYTGIPANPGEIPTQDVDDL